MEYYAIIVAAGRGSRMNSSIPKQFIKINGMPVLHYSVQAFLNSKYKPQIIIALPAATCPATEEYINNYLNGRNDIMHVSGGAERSDSVINALKKIPAGNGIVAIHDAARPLIKQKTIDDCYAASGPNKAVISAAKCTNTMRYLNDDGTTETLNRDRIVSVHTPQCFVKEDLVRLYTKAGNKQFTDDAGLAEFYGWEIVLVPDSKFNIKITDPEDLDVVTQLIKKPF